MIPDWETDCCYFSDRLQPAHPLLFANLKRILASVKTGIVPGTHDIWCRDFMPIQTDEQHFSQFVYAPDYLRGYEHQITPPERRRLPFMTQLRQESILLDGGNVVASESKVILTDKVFRENSSIPEAALKDRLEGIFSAECVIIPQEPYDEVGHADGMVRFISENHVLINDYSTLNRPFDRRLRTVLERSGLAVDTLPMIPVAQTRGKFQSAVGIYTNFLRVGEIVVVPAFDLPADELALEIMQRTLPNATVIQLPCRELAQQGGVLNCISWTIKAKH